MIDTVKLKSPPLSPQSLGNVRNHLIQHTQCDIGTSEILQEYVQGAILGPFGAVIKASLPAGRNGQTGNTLVLEASPHKLLLGHNVAGGPLSFQPTCRWLVNLASGLLGAALPPADAWAVERADWAETYRLPRAVIPRFFESLHTARYPRRKTRLYGNESLTFSGDTTTVMLYHKGPEFAKSDRDRLRAVLPPSEFSEVQGLAWDTLRGEVQVKAHKLVADFGAKPCVHRVPDDYLPSLYDREMARIAFDGTADATVRRSADVVKRLYSCHSPRQARSLLSLWCMLKQLGEDTVRRQIASSYYRNRPLLLKAGCSWLATDVVDCEGNRDTESFPSNFSLKRDSNYRFGGEDSRVTSQLRAFTCPTTVLQ